MVDIHWLHYRHSEVSGLEGDGTVVNEPMQHAQTSVVSSNGSTSQAPRGTKEQTLHPNTQQAKHDNCICREIS